MSNKTEVVQIDVSKKYAIVVPKCMSIEQKNKFADLIDYWLKSKATFILLDDGVELVKLQE